MRGTQPADMTSVKQHFSSWSTEGSGLFRDNKLTEREDEETYRKPPAPSAFQAPEILSHFRPDPLLLVTPEKSIGLAALDRNNCSITETQGSRTEVSEEAGKREKLRVRFAPGTVTSPPSKSGDNGGVGAGSSAGDDDSVPRSFSSVSQKLYQPALYADSDEEQLSADRPVSSASAPPRRYTVETRGNSTVYVPMVKNMTSDSYGSKAGVGRVVRHKLADTASYSCDDDGDGASDTEVKEVFRYAPPTRRSPKTVSRSASTSPSRSRRSSPHSAPRSPSSCRSSPTRSPGRLTPVTVSGPDLLSFTDDPEPPVRVVREAQLRPKISEYLFPFQGEEAKYDSTKENPLARPEFNSTVKISQELKSAKAKRPDTWGAVNSTLKTSERKRTEIQEKASSKVNVQMQSELYSDLVDIDVPLDDICQNLEKGISLKAPVSKPAAAKVPVGREPDIMEFFSPDIQQELPDLTLTGIQPITESLSTANPILAFDLYRHNRSWDGLTDS